MNPHSKSTQNKNYRHGVYTWTAPSHTEGEDMRKSVNFRFHVVTEYSFALFVSEIFHLSACVCVCLTILPVGHPECADCKRIAHQYSWVYAFINVAANCLRSNSQLVSASTLVYFTRRGRVKGGRGRERENKERARTATDGPVLPADEKETLRKKGKDHTDDGRRRSKKSGRSRKESENQKRGVRWKRGRQTRKEEAEKRTEES